VRVIKSCALLVINFYFFIDSKTSGVKLTIFFILLALPSNNVLSDLQIAFEKRAGGEASGEEFVPVSSAA